MTITLNDEQLELLKDAMFVYYRATKEELDMWERRGAKECIESCKHSLEIIREIENIIY